MNKAGAVLIFIGFFLAVGTAGASDTNNIGFSQMFIQFVIALVIMIVGVSILYIKHRKEKNKSTLFSSKAIRHNEAGKIIVEGFLEGLKKGEKIL
jgi:ABC-type uncharacterized transport system permease subunit